MKMSKWDNITVRQFIDIRKAIESNSNLPRMQVEVLSRVTKYDSETLYGMPYQQVKELAHKYEWAFTYPQGEISERFRFKGRKFEAILNAFDISAGQFIDGVELSKGSEIELLEKLPTLLGVLLKDVTPRYKFWKKRLKQKEIIDLVSDMPISYVYPNVVFFCRVYKELLRYIPTYLVAAAKELNQLAQDS